MGRPRKYSDKFVKKQAILLLKYAKKENNPILEEFCCQQRYSPQRITDFKNRVPLFEEALNRFKAYQLYKLCKGRFPLHLTTFLLKNLHGYKESIEHTGEVKGIDNRIMVVNNTEKKQEVKSAQESPVAQIRSEAVPV